jgi:hypothetical protein
MFNLVLFFIGSFHPVLPICEKAKLGFLPCIYGLSSLKTLAVQTIRVLLNLFLSLVIFAGMEKIMALVLLLVENGVISHGPQVACAVTIYVKSMSNSTNTTQPAAAPKSKVRSLIIKIGIGILLVLGFIFYWNYYNPYSEGERIGKDLKLSNKGNIFKTCEGYFTEGCRDVVSNPVTFTFSVADSKVEEKLMQLQLDPNACIRVSYKEYRKTLFWRGDSQYIITEASKLDS